MPTAKKPKSITLRTYQVGFGDCFLMTFHYTSGDKHVLIDFGSTGAPKTSGDDLMLRIAQDIQTQCAGKLHLVVATHRHADHISGFATNRAGKAPGDLIAACKPDVVLQPWTEDPDADPVTGTVKGDRKMFTASLRNMHGISQSVLTELNQRPTAFGKTLRGELSFLGEDNLTNKSAVENLMEMGKAGKAFYLRCDDTPPLGSVLPGVKLHVLGPPDLKQSEAIRKMRTKDENEYWHLQAQAGASSAQTKGRLFPKAAILSAADRPPFARWFIKRCHKLRGEQLLGIMRALDDVMNNTSLILLFEVGGMKLLFPGDAQIENWSFALSQAGKRKLLEDVNVYKVGHHGSLNATPKSLWNKFTHKDKPGASERLTTVVSTMAGKHGKPANKTEVPRGPLVDALKAESDFFTTQDLKGASKFFMDLTFDL